MRLDDGRTMKGYTPIPKMLTGKIRDTKLSETERVLVDVIIEQTLHFQKLMLIVFRILNGLRIIK